MFFFTGKRTHYGFLEALFPFFEQNIREFCLIDRYLRKHLSYVDVIAKILHDIPPLLIQKGLTCTGHGIFLKLTLPRLICVIQFCFRVLDSSGQKYVKTWKWYYATIWKPTLPHWCYGIQTKIMKNSRQQKGEETMRGKNCINDKYRRQGPLK